MSDATTAKAQYGQLLATAEAAEKAYDEAVAAFMTFLREHAVRGAEKPWGEICGNLDAYWLNEDTDEDGYGVQCQFPKNHAEELGIRYHYDDGNEWTGGHWPTGDENVQDYPAREGTE